MRIAARRISVLAAAATLAAIGPVAIAAPDEIQVYTEELNDPGQYGLELHVNYALKGACKAAEGVHAGFEYYGEFGPLHHRLPASERAHYVYAVADVETRNVDIDFGIGRGIENASDQWLAKAIISFPFK